MGEPVDFDERDVRLMQGLAQRVDALRPELVNTDATFGELAWIWGKDHAEIGDSWRRRLWVDDAGALAGWGWATLPYRVRRSDGGFVEVKDAYLAWQTHPDRPELLDGILDWYDDEATPGLNRLVNVRVANKDALDRLAAHGYVVEETAAGDKGTWPQYNGRDLAEIEEPVLPEGFRFRTAEQVTPQAAVKAHVDAWHPSTFTERAFEGVRANWSYRPDLHVLLEAPDGTLVSTAIIWLDPDNRAAEFEPVGTHRDYRRRGLGRALLLWGMQRAREAGAERMRVACLGAPAYPAARGLYLGVGFREFTRDLPYVKRVE